MSHDIENNNCFFTHQPAWHQLGVVLDHPPTSAEAIQAAGMQWDVLKKQIYFRKDMPGGHEYCPAKGRMALVRSSDHKFLSVVSELYEPFQNRDAFKFFDPIVSDGLATYESAGVLREGKRIWVLARLVKDLHIGDDVVRSYLLLCNSHDGSMRLSVSPTGVRVVCNNTLQMALKQGMIDTFRHVGGILDNMGATRDRIIDLIAGFDNMETELNAFKARQLLQDEVEHYVELVLRFPDSEFAGAPEADITETGIVEADLPDDNSGDVVVKVEQASAYKRKAKAEILRIHEEGDGADLCRGTVWGIYQAVTAFVDHYANPNSKDRANYQIFGAGAEMKIKALEVAKDIIEN